MPSAFQPIIKVENLSFTGEGGRLENINLELFNKQYVGLIGENGSGKSTFLKLLIGYLKPNAGDIYLFNQKINEFKDWYKIAYLPQRVSFQNHSFPTTVLELVEVGRQTKIGFSKKFNKVDHEAVQKAIEIMELQKYTNTSISELSGGIFQRTLLAQCLAKESKVIILDEPMTGVDSKSEHKFYDFLRYLNKNLEITIIFVSHNLSFIQNEVNSIWCLNNFGIHTFSPSEYVNKYLVTNAHSKQNIAHPHLHIY